MAGITGSDDADAVEGTELDAFFPKQITVNAGDSIFFDVHGFHNVHFYPNGGQPVPSFIPDPAAGSPVAGAPRILINPQVAFPTPGMTVDGGTEVNSGLPLGEPQPVVIAFSTAGTYEYWCDIHAEVQMKGTVVVQEAGAAVPMDQAAVDQAAQSEMTALRENVQALLAEYTTTGTPVAGGAHEVMVGLSAPEIEVNAFLPRDLTIAVGDTVRFNYTSTDPAVPHTVSFASGGEVPDFIQAEGGQNGPPHARPEPGLPRAHRWPVL